MVYPVIDYVYPRSNLHCPIFKSFDRPKPQPTPIVSESNISLSSMEDLRQQNSTEGLSDQIIDLLESSRRPAHCIITKWGGESGVAGVFLEKIIPFLHV